MQKVARKIFYTGLIRFQILLFVLTILPLVAIKVILLFYPANINSILNILILCALSLAIVAGCFYVLAYYASVDKTLKPITKMAEVGEMAARVAHDLRGPLSGIKAVLEFFHHLKREDPKFTSHLNLLDLSARRLEHVAHDLLKKHRGEEEEQALFNLHEVLDELVGEYSSQPVLASVNFHKKYVHRPLSILGKRNKVERMFGNIIKNAIEAIDFEGEITIQTQLEQESASVLIQDSGPGLTPEKIKKILSGSFTEGKRDGHGLGLTFVKEVLAEHGGSLRIQSRPGQGAGFQLFLPVVKEDSDLFVLEVLPDQSVVVIDDDPSILEEWHYKLSQKGCSVILAASLEDLETKQISAETSPTAIVDYHFENSEWNGFQIIQKLKQKGWRHLYLCTAEYWKPSLKREAEELGVMVCPKPLPKIEIRTRDLGLGTRDLQLEKGYKVLVIDDEPSIRLAWDVIQGKLHIEQLYSYPNLESFLEAKLDLDGIDIAFVDKNIRNSKYSGAEALNYLKSKGIPKVVLASGENEEDLREDPQFSQADFITSEKIPVSFKPFFS